MGQTDSDLMTQVREGREAALGELFERYHVTLFRFCLRMTGNRAVSEDLVQDIFMRMLKHRKSFRPNTTFTPWMYRIARNLLIDNIRRQSHDALIRAVKGRSDEDERDLMAQVAEDLLPPEVRAGQSELADLVDELLRELPEEQRLTFLLHHFSQLTLSEVADVMETSLPTTKSRLRLAREKLQAMLAPRGVTEEMRVER